MKFKLGDKTVLSLSKKKVEEEKIDLFKFFKKKQVAVCFILALLIAALSFHIRTLDIKNLGDYVLELDTWLFYRYAMTIIDTGSLPTIDYMRNFPDGYYTPSESIITSYMMVYFYKGLKIFIPDLKPVTALQYYSPFMNFLAQIMFYFLATKLFNKKVGLLASLTLAFIPGFLFRSIGGFLDKEGSAMFLIFATIYFYVAAIKSKNLKTASINSLISGAFMGLSGMSWGGWIFVMYGVAMHSILMVLAEKVKKRDILVQFIWFIPIGISDLLTARYNLVTFIPFDMALFGFLAMVVRIYLYPFFLRKVKDVDKLPAGVVSLILAFFIGMAGAVIVLTPGYMIEQIRTISVILTDPLGGNNAMGQSVSENQQPFFDSDWTNSLGKYYVIFIFLGAIILMHETFRKVYSNHLEPLLKMTLPFSLLLFVIVFSRYKVNDPLTNSLAPLYQPTYVLMILWYLGVFLYEWKRGKNFSKVDASNLMLLILFALLAIGARGAVRLLVPFLPIAVITGSYFFVRVYELLRDNLKDDFYRYAGYAVIGLTAFILIASPFNISLGSLQVSSFYNQIMASAPYFGPSVYGDWEQSYAWIRENTSQNAVFAHWWDYGYWIQSVANRTTVTDGGNARTDWNYLMGHSLFGGVSLGEVHDVLRQLSSPDYFYVVSDDIGKFYQMERIGGHNTYYTLLLAQSTEANALPGVNATEFPQMIVYTPSTGAVVAQEDFVVNGKLFAKDQTYITHVFVPYSPNGSISAPLAGVYNQVYGQALLPINGFCEQGRGCYDIASGGVPDYFAMMQNGAIWVPKKASQMFMTQQYLLNRNIPGFDLVWESSAPLTDMRTLISSRQNIRIYKLNYTEMEKAISEGYSWT